MPPPTPKNGRPQSTIPPPKRLGQIRSGILTFAVASIAATGAWYGANLKQDTQTKKTVNKVVEASPEERIAILEEQKAGLLGKRLLLQQKLEQIHKREAGASREESLVGRERRRDG